MKKRAAALLCAAMLMCLPLAGCGGNSSNVKTTEANTTVAAEVQTTEADTTAAAEVQTTEASAAEKETESEDITTAEPVEAIVLEDGVYHVNFDTDSSMFHVNEACEGKGVLTVADGKMTLHISLPSKNVVNLYPGLAEDAQKEGAELLQPTLDTVTYSDGTSEEVNGFDVPIPAVGPEFDLALVGTKGKWYDHKVSVSNPESAE